MQYFFPRCDLGIIHLFSVFFSWIKNLKNEYLLIDYNRCSKKAFNLDSEMNLVYSL
jgi:hypothetical protein